MSVGLVTGRAYEHTRVRGEAPWNPDVRSLSLVRSMLAVIAEYAQPITMRQIFYRLVATIGYPKTDQTYKALCEKSNRARRAGLIRWDALRDDDDIVPPRPGWRDPPEFWEYVWALGRTYYARPDLERYLEVWVEAAGMVPQIEAVADPFGVRVIASGGFSSVTARRAAADRFLRHGVSHVLLVGDYDPSGQSIMDSSAEDIRAFGADVEFEQLAVTLDQADEYQLESAPQKATDRRGTFMAQTYQAEALDPDDLASLVRDRLQELVGEDSLTEAAGRTQVDRAQILAALESLS